MRGGGDRAGWPVGIAGVGLALAAAMSAGGQAMAGDAFEAPVALRWNGVVPEIQSADGAFRLRPRARVQVDGSVTEDSAFPDRNRSGTEVRSLLFGVEGAVKGVSYAVNVDFANHQSNVRNAYLAWRGQAPVGEWELTLGNRMTERSLEGSSSSEATPFLERNVVAQAIIPLKGSYGLGVMTKLYGANWHLAAQVAGDDINNPEVTRDTVTTSVRGHWNPVKSPALLVHVGGWAFHEDFTDRVTRLSRNTFWGGQHFDDALQVSLGAIAGPRTSDGYGLELGALTGPAWSFVEYGQREIAASAGHVTVRAWSAEAGWFLTGEHAPYTARTGAFMRMAPREPVSHGGPGAIEVSGRIEHLDNTDAPQGGLGDAVTLGVSWRLEEWLRVTVNASRWTTENQAGAFIGTDDGESLTTRLQLAF
ncbi:MAG: OprO/OprP family phosphate-selective porin [Alphaproteobacteria bacterium]|nr:OprO/OprP family phosphate-selective porin [Alphaproteobacteria bacterium]MBU1513775.1 OprO/OprP family phosphate-selective porin [Alphaproteobacteria bacterium]MBU2094580.1 OprO/OprP family phosphate-selective porin [Alphaproteobacteria bacterium]MBU2149661.1 OprO/OprP family phosphate-selective porin [Alphaproteobacteria bacterium]MBU2362395.1 OprO/OprP family phosphate-selective porin [Alphaproteobacteria bacterium]